jgi:hypothetical protein
MPCRLIRDDMLDSERVLALPVEARWLYVTILLSADDLGLFEATSFKLARRSDIRREAGEQLLGMLADADLVRLYEANGKRYGFIPRFRQRIQIKFLKHPAPPESLLHDDDDALIKIKQLGERSTVGQRMDNGCSSDGQPSEAKAKAKAKETENSIPTEKNRTSRQNAVASLSPKPMEVSDGTWLSFLALRRAKRAPVTDTVMVSIRREAAKAGMGLEAALELCCLRGWTGFRAEWVQKQAPRMSAADRAAETVARLTGKRDLPPLPSRMIDVDDLG